MADEYILKRNALAILMGDKVDLSPNFVFMSIAIDPSSIDKFKYLNFICDRHIDLIKAIPAEDVSPVKHSFWEITEEHTINNKVEMSRCRCVKCGFIHWFADNHFGQYMFCPQCGADMRKDGA